MARKIVLLLLGALSIVCAISHGRNSEWRHWKKRFGKEYSNEEIETKRRLTWHENVKRIYEHNIRYDLDEELFKLAVNQYSDLSNEEFKGFLENQALASFPNQRHRNDPVCSRRLMRNFEMPDSVDWRTKGYVTPVKNQGQCLASLFFSVTGSLEGQWFKRTSDLISLSEQNLADCAFSQPSGCSGVELDLPTIYGYIERNGLESLSDYPDNGGNGTCQFDPKKSAAICSGYELLPADNEMQLQKAVAAIGPISAVINASPASFQSYAGGVYNDPTCTPEPLNMAVLIVGYGTDPTGGDYWIVKNSWGTSWGEEGYIRMSRNKDNQCGIASYNFYPYYTC